MRRPRCGTCRHFVADEGSSICVLLPPTPLQLTGASAHSIVAPWGGCAQHSRSPLRSLKALGARLLGRPGNDPKRLTRHYAAKAVKVDQ